MDFSTLNHVIDQENIWQEIELRIPTRKKVEITNQGLDNDLDTQVLIDIYLRNKGSVPSILERGLTLGTGDSYHGEIPSNIGIWVKSSTIGASITVVERG
jgi:hypothetical protein